VADFRAVVPAFRFQPTLDLAPDGGAVVYSTNRTGRFELWIHPLDGVPRRLTTLPRRSVRKARFSPDGRAVVFTADLDGDEQHQVFLVDLVDGDVGDVGDVGGGGESGQGGAPRPLTAAKAQFNLPDRPFSPDGTRLAYAGNDRDPGVQDLIVADLAAGTSVRLVPEPGMIAEPAGFAPDGRTLLVWAMRGNDDTDLFLVAPDDPGAGFACVTGRVDHELHAAGPWAPDGSGFHELTDAGRDHRVLAFRDLAGAGGEPVSDPEWDAEEVAGSRDGTTLVWTVDVDGTSVLAARRAGRDLPVPPIPAGQISGLSVSADGRRVAFLLDAATRPTDVAVVDLDAGTFEFLTDSRPAALLSGAVRPIAPEIVRYPVPGGGIPALLYRPDGPGPFPVVLSIHGGPEAQERPVYRYAGLYQHLLAAGIGVLAPNAHGSTGYGAAYQRSIHRDWGGVDLADFEGAAAFLRATPWADPGRVGVFGASYGGFAALSCLSRLPELWACGVSVVGPSNLVTFAAGVPPTWRPLMARWIGDPEADAEFLTARSPLTHADRIRAPLFVVHGARDPRVPLAESEQIVASLRARGVPVRLDVYEDEGHGFTSRDNEIRAWESVAEFLIDTLRR
jgi:dipeptidyl aminopeptidase/acylaminoacyl peptidase